MQKTKRIYQDTRTQNNLTKLNEDLQDVTRIMTKNMEDLLWRGDSLDRKWWWESGGAVALNEMK